MIASTTRSELRPADFEEEWALGLRAADGDMAARHELTERSAWAARYVAAQSFPPGPDRDDAAQMACLRIFEATAAWTKSEISKASGKPFTRNCALAISRRAIRSFRRQLASWPVRVPHDQRPARNRAVRSAKQQAVFANRDLLQVEPRDRIDENNPPFEFDEFERLRQLMRELPEDLRTILTLRAAGWRCSDFLEDHGFSKSQVQHREQRGLHLLWTKWHAKARPGERPPRPVPLRSVDPGQRSDKGTTRDTPTTEKQQRAYAAWVRCGRSYQAAAESLGWAYATVAAHVRAARTKLPDGHPDRMTRPIK